MLRLEFRVVVFCVVKCIATIFKARILCNGTQRFSDARIGMSVLDQLALIFYFLILINYEDFQNSVDSVCHDIPRLVSV